MKIFTKSARGGATCFLYGLKRGIAKNDKKNYNSDMKNYNLKVGFTLAEVLITLAIIGIVAAITLPTLLTNITERANSYREANVALKVTKAMEKMQALGLLDGSYHSTDEFVDELQKHLKVSKRCSANNISDCWPSSKVITGDGKEFDVSLAKQGKHLNIKENKTDNVALVLGDGASIILTYNQSAPAVDFTKQISASKKSLPVGSGKTKDFAYTSSAADSIDFVMDINGAKGPNSESRDGKVYDIRSFRAARFTEGCRGVEIDGVGCVIDLGSTYDCIDTPSRNCFSGAKEACAKLGMTLLPDKNTLAIIWESGQFPDYVRNEWYWKTDGCASSLSSNNGVCYKNQHNYAMCIGN